MHDLITQQFVLDDDVGSLIMFHYTMYAADAEDTYKIENMEGQRTIMPEDGMVRALTLDDIEYFVEIPAGRMVVEDVLILKDRCTIHVNWVRSSQVQGTTCMCTHRTYLIFHP